MSRPTTNKRRGQFSVILIITAVALAAAGVLGLSMRGGDEDSQRTANDSA